MERRWDEQGYSLDSTGEGPFAIYFELSSLTELRAMLLNDPYARVGYGRFQPFEARLVNREISLVTVVTPDSGSPFVASLLAAVGRTFAERQD
jgi:hypothetical protein